MTGKELLEKLKNCSEELLNLPIFLGYSTSSVSSSGTGWSIENEEQIDKVNTELIELGNTAKKTECIVLTGESYY